MAPAQTPLEKILLDTLRRSGAITFQQYMAFCLYHPEDGYYMRGPERTGVRGDYFTSSDLHPIFARLVARQAAEMWEILGCPARFSWVEMGAGRGWFARDFLLWVRGTRPDFWIALDYVAIEPSQEARARVLGRLTKDAVAAVEVRPQQRDRQSGADTVAAVSDRRSSAQRAPLQKVRGLTNLEELEPITGCFFSNELVDAFPVSIVTRANGRLREIYVTAEAEMLGEKLGPISDPAIAAAVARYANGLEEGDRVEVNLAAVRWIRTVAEKLARGFVLTIDYGELAERLYTADRPRGTLMAYHGRMASEDFFSNPGEQDLTAHVNFTALIDAGKEAGLRFTGLTTQERFLMALGEANEFADLYDPGQTEAEQLQARLKLKRLIFPGEPGGPGGPGGREGMGNVFKVLIQHRGMEAPKLTGLKFRDE